MLQSVTPTAHKPINYPTHAYDCFITYRHKPTGKKRDKRTYKYITYVRATSPDSATSLGARIFTQMHQNSIIVDVHAARTFPLSPQSRWSTP